MINEYKENVVIPKIIHYCWFGNNPLPSKVKECIASWRKYFPDYEIKEWNETNFDLKSNLYAKEAYDSKKWAFVADYVRLYVLVKYGGIYLDTDVEMVKNMDLLLKYKGFCCFETKNQLCTAVLACEPHFKLFEKWLHFYDTKVFDFDYEEPNVLLFTRICQKYGLKLDNKRQSINGLQVFPSEYFSPKDYMTGEIVMTNNTFAIHHFSESWHSNLEIRMHKREQKIIQKFGYSNGIYISKIINFPFKVYNALVKRGVKGEIQYVLSKFK